MEDDVGQRTPKHEPSRWAVSITVSVAVSLAVCALGAMTGCGGAQTKTGEESSETKPADSSAPDIGGSGDEKPAPKSSPKSESKADELNDAQREQMEIALRRGGDKAGNCDRVVPGSAVGEGEVKVTFDGKKGRAVDVTVPAPWAGTDAEACIKRAFIGEIIVPFEGQLEVPYTVKVGKKADDSAKPAKGKKK